MGTQGKAAAAHLAVFVIQLQIIDRPSDEQGTDLRVVIGISTIVTCENLVEDKASFLTALLKGTSPDGRHYYPAFPYTSYQRMKQEDARDLFAYLGTLPPVQGKVRDHDLPVYLRVTQADGHQAWSSPIYLIE